MSSASLSPIESVFRAHASPKLLLSIALVYQQLAAEAKEAAEAAVGVGGNGSAMSDEPVRAVGSSAAASAPGGPAEPFSSLSLRYGNCVSANQQQQFYACALPL